LRDEAAVLPDDHPRRRGSRLFVADAEYWTCASLTAADPSALASDAPAFLVRQKREPVTRYRRLHGGRVVGWPSNC